MRTGPWVVTHFKPSSPPANLDSTSQHGPRGSTHSIPTTSSPSPTTQPVPSHDHPYPLVPYLHATSVSCKPHPVINSTPHPSFVLHPSTCPSPHPFKSPAPPFNRPYPSLLLPIPNHKPRNAAHAPLLEPPRRYTNISTTASPRAQAPHETAPCWACLPRIQTSCLRPPKHPSQLTKAGAELPTSHETKLHSALLPTHNRD